MKDNKLVEELDDEYSKKFSEMVADDNLHVVSILSERLCDELLVKLLAIHGYKKTKSQLAKLGRRFNKTRMGTAND